MIIEKMALEELAVFNSSCPSSNLKSLKNSLYLLDCDRKYVDLDFSTFLAGFPEKNLAYHNYKILGEFAEREGAGKISLEMVRRFFGGSFHINLIVDQLRGIELGRGYKNRYLFAHLLIPVRITGTNPLSGVYRNFGREVALKNLLIHPRVEEEILEGREVFCHFSSIISPADPLMREWLLEEQRESPVFSGAVELIEKIDYEIFPTLGKISVNDWTREFWRECNF